MTKAITIDGHDFDIEINPDGEGFTIDEVLDENGDDVSAEDAAFVREHCYKRLVDEINQDVDCYEREYAEYHRGES